VVVVNAGRPVDCPWAEEVPALMFAWLPGQGFGAALAEVLDGTREPAGRLPVSLPLRDQDRSTWGERLDAGLALDYSATEPVGYRHLARSGLRPRFAFGEGLGYTRWEHRDARARPIGGGRVEVTATVANAGDRHGREVVQVYVRGPGEPEARLAGFAGVRLDPGASAEVRLVLDERAFARWDTASGTWAVPPGRHDVLVGRSSVDLRYTVTVEPAR
jgi:beta-glucosidase